MDLHNGQDRSSLMDVVNEVKRVSQQAGTRNDDALRTSPPRLNPFAKVDDGQR
jgi:hypothetical protein